MPQLTAFMIFAWLLTSTALGQELGTLKARFVFEGDVVAPKHVDVNKDKDFCGKQAVVDERLLVHATDKGIRNVVLYLYTGRSGYRDPLEKRPAKTVTLTTKDCRFDPHVIAIQAGDTLEILPGDPLGHNANLNFFANKPQGISVPPMAKRVIPIAEAEPGVIPIDCNIHPWMRAYAVILDHPLVAISDEHGQIEIEGLPTGRLPFRLFHEAADAVIPEVTIDGKKEKLSRNVIELEIKPGLNDFGTITLPADALKP